MTTNETLDHDVARREFARAKRSWFRVVVVQSALVAVPGVVALLAVPWIAYVGGVLALLGTVSLFFLRGVADSSYARAESIRRLLLVSKGLGRPIAPGVAMSALAEASTKDATDPEPEGEYFNSNLQPGLQRLVHHLWESAHCTVVLAGVVAAHVTAVAVAGGAVVIAAFFSALWFGTSASFGVQVSMAGSAMLGLFGFGAFAELARTYHGLSTTAGKTCTRCEGLLERATLNLPDAIAVVEDYNVAVAQAAPIPTYVWRWKQKALAESWKLAQLAYGKSERATLPGLSQDIRDPSL